MKYSVIIPCYKCEATLKKTVASIQACGLTDFEIILVDDGSPDGTPALCDRLAAEHGNVRCFHQTNGGVSSARNHGLAEAVGDYVWFFDSDDLVDPGSMTCAEQIIDEYTPDMLIFGMRFEYYTAKGTLYQQLDLVYEEEGVFSRDELTPLYEELFHCNSLSSACNKLIRRELMLQEKIHFDEKLFAMEDFHFALAAIEKCKSIYLLPSVIYRYVHQQENKSSAHTNTRASRIEDIATYIVPFEPLLNHHPKLLLELFFMLLRQKLDTQKPREIEKTALQFLQSKYSTEPFVDYYTSDQRLLAEQLRENRCSELFAEMKQLRRRRKLVGFVKQSAIYRVFKGTEPRKARF